MVIYSIGIIVIGYVKHKAKKKSASDQTGGMNGDTMDLYTGSKTIAWHGFWIFIQSVHI